MNKSESTSMRTILVLNCIALVLFAALFWVQPLFTDLRVRSHYTDLDRTGVIVINEAAIEKFDPNCGFAPGTWRSTVPRFIAGPALEAQRTNAGLGIALAAINALIVGGFLIAAKWSVSAKTEPNADQQ